MLRSQIGDLNVSIFTGFSDRWSDSFGQNLIPSYWRSERLVKLIRSDRWSDTVSGGMLNPTHSLIMVPSFLEGGPIMCWSSPSVCLSVPCLHLEGKRKGLWIPNLVGRVPGTPAPRGPILRSRGQRSRSQQLIALLAKIPITLPPVVRSTWYLAGGVRIPCRLAPGDLVAMGQQPFRPSVRPFVRRVPTPRAKTKWPRKTELSRKGPCIPWTNFKVKGSKVKVTAANCAVCQKSP